MQKPLKYGFNKQLVFSQGIAHGEGIKNILLSNIPGADKILRSNEVDDRMGTDWWIQTKCGDRLSVDAKVRTVDWAAKLEPYRVDDLALETWSVVERQKVGWTRDPNKRTDYILWFWVDSGRWCLIPFLMLCKIFDDNWQSWVKVYKTRQQYTQDGNYHSECVFVPRHQVWAEIYKVYGGSSN